MKASENQSGFYLLSENTDAFIARFALATVAEKTLDIQYYIVRNDASAQYLAYAILSAADRGVQVRILVDDINLSGRDSRIKMLSQHKNIQIRIFNPLSNRNWFKNIELVINLDRAGRRMHNKAFIVDNSAAIIGGRNIGDEYFDARHQMNYVDLDLLTIGPIVNDITDSFDDYWQSQWATKIEDLSKTQVLKKQLSSIRNKLKDRWHHLKNTNYFETLKQADLTQRIINKEVSFAWAEAHLFYDRPEKLNPDNSDKTIHVGPQVMPYFEQAKKQLLFSSPYFVPGSAGVRWFDKKRHEGVQIKILTNSLASTEVTAVHTGYKKYRKGLLKTGLDLFELKPSARPSLLKVKKFFYASGSVSLHAKYMVLDQRYVFIGSANLDPRSENLNTEIGIMVDSEELAKQTTQLFERATSAENCYKLSLDKEKDGIIWQTLNNGKKAQYRHDPGASLFKKIAVFLWSLLPIEKLL
jgi:putative cardiolipin synthase